MPRSFENSGYVDYEKYVKTRKRTRDIENRKKRDFIDAYRESCFFCGAEENIEFHHKNPTEKEFRIAAMRRKSYKDIEAEISKCWTLCKDCHVKLHQRLCDPLPSAYDD